MSKMVRNLVTVKDEGKGADMKRFVSSHFTLPCIIVGEERNSK